MRGVVVCSWEWVVEEREFKFIPVREERNAKHVYCIYKHRIVMHVDLRRVTQLPANIQYSMFDVRLNMHPNAALNAKWLTASLNVALSILTSLILTFKVNTHHISYLIYAHS